MNETIALSVKILSSSQARDKLNRFIQYSSKLSKNELFLNLGTQFAKSRQIQRLFMFMENYLVIETSRSLKDIILRVFTIAKAFGLG